MKIPYSAAFQLKELLGRFKVDSYSDVEIIRQQVEKLPLTEFAQKHNGDQKLANELWQTESTVSKEDFAWLTKEEFKMAIEKRGFEASQVEFLEFWIVK